MSIMSVVVVHYIFCFVGSLILFYSVSDDVRKTPLWVVIVCTPLVMIVFYLILFFFLLLIIFLVNGRYIFLLYFRYR